MQETQETQVQSPGRGDSPGEGNGHSSILAWEMPRAEEPGGYGVAESDTTEH